MAGKEFFIRLFSFYLTKKEAAFPQPLL